MELTNKITGRTIEASSQQARSLARSGWSPSGEAVAAAEDSAGAGERLAIYDELAKAAAESPRAFSTPRLAKGIADPDDDPSPTTTSTTTARGRAGSPKPRI